MRSIRYEYDIVTGINKDIVLDQAKTREKARQIKKTLDNVTPEMKHTIVQRRYKLETTKNVR